MILMLNLCRFLYLLVILCSQNPAKGVARASPLKTFPGKPCFFIQVLVEQIVDVPVEQERWSQHL